jgi:phospholipid/cholesterol/gamma-HCH transport system permease protein
MPPDRSEGSEPPEPPEPPAAAEPAEGHEPAARAGSACALALRPGPQGLLQLELRGHWQLAHLPEAERLLDEALRSHAPATASAVQIDGPALQALDTAGALAIVRAIRRDLGTHDIRGGALQAHHARVLSLVMQRLPASEPLPGAEALPWRARLGASAWGLWRLQLGHVAFLGRVAEAAAHTARAPRSLRLQELGAQLGQTGVAAIPVVALVTFLIGVVFAYLLGLQAEQYGANIFVVDGVALGMTREFSPLIVATIVAGRSGAAFTAQLGTMKLTEEIDAIRTLGLSVESVLVLPRVLALMLTLPLLVFVGDVAGLSGALVIANSMLDLTPQGFIERLQSALAPRHYLIGLAKAPVFALFIAVIGCRMGMDVARDTRSIGIHTTSTVVQAIVAVIILDAIFAIVCQKLGW